MSPKTAVRKMMCAVVSRCLSFMAGDLELLHQTIPPAMVRQLASVYGVRLNHHGVAQGIHTLTIEGGQEQIKHQIPPSVYFNTGSGNITVGRNTVFGENVMILTGKHLNVRESEEAGLPLHYTVEGGRDVLIGTGCYFGSGAIIIGPIKIGDYAIISAGAVVRKDVPERAFVAGNPARVIKQI